MSRQVYLILDTLGFPAWPTIYDTPEAALQQLLPMGLGESLQVARVELRPVAYLSLTERPARSPKRRGSPRPLPQWRDTLSPEETARARARVAAGETLAAVGRSLHVRREGLAAALGEVAPVDDGRGRVERLLADPAQASLSGTDLAAKAGVSREYVSQVRRERGGSARVRELLADPAWAGKTDKELAAEAGVTPQMAGRVRRAQAEGPPAEAPGELLGAKLLLAEPGLPSRIIAQRVGCTADTVRLQRRKLAAEAPATPPAPEQVRRPQVRSEHPMLRGADAADAEEAREHQASLLARTSALSDSELLRHACGTPAAEWPVAALRLVADTLYSKTAGELAREVGAHTDPLQVEQLRKALSAAVRGR